MKKTISSRNINLNKIWGGVLWQQFIPFIERFTQCGSNLSGGSIFLEIGAREGFVSEIFRGKFNIICSDLFYDNEQFKKNTPNFTYKNINCLNVDIKSGTVDVVVMKSVLGGLKTFENQCRAFDEIYRVLKPGGLFIFAENTKGLSAHRVLRRLKSFNQLKYWRYISDQDIKKMSSRFKILGLQYSGVVSGNGGWQLLDKFLFKIDCWVLHRIIKSDSRVLVFGCLEK